MLLETYVVEEHPRDALSTPLSLEPLDALLGFHSLPAGELLAAAVLYVSKHAGMPLRLLCPALAVDAKAA